MSILTSVRAWFAKRDQREREEYAEERGFATDEELNEVRKDSDGSRVKAFHEGKGMLPTDFDADDKPPPY